MPKCGCAVMVAVCLVAGGVDASATERPDTPAPVEAPKPSLESQRRGASRRSLLIDVGRFTPFGRGIRVEIGKTDRGKRRVHVEVQPDVAPEINLKVDVNSDASRRRDVGTGADVRRGPSRPRRTAPDPDDRPSPRNQIPPKVELGPSSNSPDEAEPVPQPAGQPVQAPVPDVSNESASQPPADKQPPPTRKETYVGIFTQPVPPAVAAQLSDVLEQGHGLLVLRVLPDSPAALAGLKPYDVLISYDGKPVTSVPQLKRLLVRDQPGRTVKLGVIRSAKRQTSELTLGQRTVPALPESGPANNAGLRRVIRLRGPNAIVIHLNGLNVAGADPRQTSGADTQPVAARVRNSSVTVVTRRGKTYRVQVAYHDDAGQSQQKQLEGTLEEIEPELNRLPPQVRAQVRQTLARVDQTRNRAVAFRFQIQPHIEGDQRGLRITVTRPEKDGQIHLSEVYQTVEGSEPLRVDDLLKMDAVARELNQLSPAIRGKVVGTLRSLRVPDVQVGVEHLQ